MFGRLDTVINNILALDSEKICVSIYRNKNIQSIILSKNRIDQLTQGKDSEGNIVGTYAHSYSPAGSVFASEGAGSFTFDGQYYEKVVGQPYNFVDTGDFMRSFFVVVYPDGFTIHADVEKEDGNLIDKYGDLLGLTDENLSELVEAMIPIFQKEVSNLIFKS